MKNLSVISLLVILFFALTFAAYIIAFKLYFSSNRLINSTKHLSRMTFQREIKVSGMSFSPFGLFNMRSFSMAAKGGFQNGSLIGINKMSAGVNLLKLMRRELIAGDLFVDGINIKLNYENSKKFDYESFFSNVKLIFMQGGKRIGLIKKIEINNIIIQNANVDLLLDRGNVKFKNIVLMSDLFESVDNFSGDISFDFEFQNRQHSASLKFQGYQGDTLTTLNISELQCKEFLLNAYGNINFLENGKISLDFNASAAELFFTGILEKITGVNYLKDAAVSSEIIEDIKISYGPVGY